MSTLSTEQSPVELEWFPGWDNFSYYSHPGSPSIPGMNIAGMATSDASVQKMLGLIQHLRGIVSVAGGFGKVPLSGWEYISSGNIEDALEVSTMNDRHSCMKLVQELPDAAVPEALETLTDLRDHYRSLENPSIRRPTPPPEYNVKPRVLSAE